MNETVAICRSAGAPALSGVQVERRMRPLLSVLSRTHEYDERFTPETQQWTDSEETLTTKWTFAASSLYALTVITSTGRQPLIVGINLFLQDMTIWHRWLMLAEYSRSSMVYSASRWCSSRQRTLENSSRIWSSKHTENCWQSSLGLHRFVMQSETTLCSQMTSPLSPGRVS